MVVCKFFLQGECKFGENCRFDHQFPTGNISGSQPQQPFHSNPNQGFVVKPANEVDTNTLLQSVHNEMVSVEKSGQWLLTCYAPFKEKALFPGFEDQSFEEIRFGFYKAQQTNSLDQYKQQLQQALATAKAKFKALQNPTKEIVQLLRSIYNTQITSPASISSNQNSVFGNKSTSVLSANNVFGKSTSSGQIGTQSSGSLFGQNSASQIFGQSNVNANTSGTFGQPTISSLFGNNNGMFTQNSNQQNSTSIFANANKNLFGAVNPSQNSKNIFNSNPQQQNIFQQSQQSLFSSVGQTQQNQSQNIFATNNPNPQFGIPSNVQISQTTPLQGSLFSQIGSSQSQSLQNKPDTTQGLAKAQIFSPQSSSIFTNQNSQTSSIPFNQNTTSVFHTPQAQSSSVFNSLGQQELSKSIFGNSNENTTGNSSLSGNIFGAGDNATIINHDAYSKLEELSEDDIKWFKSNDLDIAAIPEKPPTYEMCFS